MPPRPPASALRSIESCSATACYTSSIRNIDGAVLRRHQLPFGIPDHQPDGVRSRLYIEAGADGQSVAKPFLYRLIQETHIDLLLIAGRIHAVAVEQPRDH